MAKVADYFKNGTHSLDDQQKKSESKVRSSIEGRKCGHQKSKKSTMKCPCESIEGVEPIKTKTKTASQDNYINSCEDASYQHDESSENLQNLGSSETNAVRISE